MSDDNNINNLAIQQLSDTVKEHTKQLKEQGESVFRSALTLEEHTRRFNNLEDSIKVSTENAKSSLEKLEKDQETENSKKNKELKEIQTYITEIKGAMKFFKGVSWIMGFLITAISLYSILGDKFK